MEDVLAEPDFLEVFVLMFFEDVLFISRLEFVGFCDSLEAVLSLLFSFYDAVSS